MFLKFAFASAMVVATVLVGGPWAIYGLGLHGTEGYPEPPKIIVPRDQQLEIWHLARGAGEPGPVALNPYTYWPLAAGSGTDEPAITVAWWVAKDFNLKHQRYPGMLWWHLSGAALTIWLSRNWSIEQLLSKAAQARLNGPA